MVGFLLNHIFLNMKIARKDTLPMVADLGCGLGVFTPAKFFLKRFMASANSFHFSLSTPP